MVIKYQSICLSTFSLRLPFVDIRVQQTDARLRRQRGLEEMHLQKIRRLFGRYGRRGCQVLGRFSRFDGNVHYSEGHRLFRPSMESQERSIRFNFIEGGVGFAKRNVGIG